MAAASRGVQLDGGRLLDGMPPFSIAGYVATAIAAEGRRDSQQVSRRDLTSSALEIASYRHASSGVCEMTDTVFDRVRSVVMEILHAIDGRRWTALPPLFTDPITTDYTSLFGGDIQRQSREQLIEGWRQLLTPLDATQHLLGPIAVRADGARAVAECHVRGYHMSTKAPGGGEWMVAGHYIFEMEARDDTWRVSSLTLQTFYQTGNRDLLRQAAAG
jgi:SnoaL-like domain